MSLALNTYIPASYTEHHWHFWYSVKLYPVISFNLHILKSYPCDEFEVEGTRLKHKTRPDEHGGCRICTI